MPMDVTIASKVNRVLQDWLAAHPESEPIAPNDAIQVLSENNISLTGLQLRDLLRDQRYSARKIIRGAWQESPRKSWFIYRDGNEPKHT